jgi:protein gp37
MKETNISWCDSTINPSSGCDMCELWSKNDRTCYAGQLHETRLAKSLPKLYAASFSEVRMIPGRMAQAANWSDMRGKDRPEKPWLNGYPRTIFIGDMGDILSRAVTDEYLMNEVFAQVTSKNGSRHFWYLLTKRPRRLAELSERMGGLPANVMAMTTITNQKTADARLLWLVKVKAVYKGISAEPVRGRINLYRSLPPTFDHGINWLICGGVSGANGEEMPDEWAEAMLDWCEAPGQHVKFFFKQRGGNGKDKGGCLLNGREYKGMPNIF